jgi:hypothetical protein
VSDFVRHLLPLILLTASVAPACAEDANAAVVPSAPMAQATHRTVAAPGAPAAPTASADTTTSSDASPQRVPHPKWEERFSKANLAHDGHLTLEEAKGGYRTIAKHFQEIDIAGKGYVTQDDIRAWHALKKSTRATAPRPEDPLRPRNAFQTTVSPEAQTLNAGTAQTVIVPVPESSHAAADASAR